MQAFLSAEISQSTASFKLLQVLPFTACNYFRVIYSYLGRLCETVYTPCSEGYDPCLHDSTCIPYSNGSFVCACIDGKSSINIYTLLYFLVT